MERHGEDQIDHQQENPDEPGRVSTAGSQGGCQRRNEHHHDRAWPEQQIHRRGSWRSSEAVEFGTLTWVD